MNNKREWKYYVIIILVVSAYWTASFCFENLSGVSTRLTTTTALIAAVTFWMQLKRSENLNEASFIMNLNNQFISNKELTQVEHALEVYHNEIQAGKDPADVKLSLQLEDRSHHDCQMLINYLVYMESLAAIIQRNVMHLGVIDDLFAYRFFLAVNNPEVQKYELHPYANYYQGCYRLAETWTKSLKNREIPLKNNPLCAPKR